MKIFIFKLSCLHRLAGLILRFVIRYIAQLNDLTSRSMKRFSLRQSSKWINTDEFSYPFSICNLILEYSYKFFLFFVHSVDNELWEYILFWMKICHFYNIFIISFIPFISFNFEERFNLLIHYYAFWDL